MANDTKETAMHYQIVRAAKFIDRPNRFIAHVELDGSGHGEVLCTA